MALVGCYTLHTDSSTVDNGKAASMVASTTKVPKSSWMHFPVLLSAVRNNIPPTDMDLIKTHYEQFRIPSNDESKDSNRTTMAMEMEIFPLRVNFCAGQVKMTL